MGVRRRVAVLSAVGVAVAVASFVLVTRDGGGGAPGSDFDIPEDGLLVPGGDVREYELTRVGVTEREVLDDDVGPLVVTRVEGHVVAVGSASAVQARARAGELGPDPRQATIGDRPTVDYGWHMTPFIEGEGEEIAWLATDDTVLSVSSRSLDLEGLVAVAGEVGLDGDGEVVVPGEVVGEIPSMWSAPRPGTSAVFERTEDFYRRIRIAVVPASRSTQEAYLALVAPDGSIDGRTVSSCCRSPIPPRRTLDVDGREAIAAALNAELHMVVLPGDPGVVLLVPGGRFQSVPHDVWLAELAGSLEAVPEDELAPFEEDAARLPG